MRLPRIGEEVVVVIGVAEALRSRPKASVTGDDGVLAMCTIAGGAAVRVRVADGASEASSLPAFRRFPPMACWVGNVVEGLRESMAAREGKEEDAIATERSGTGSATMQNE